ncbi:MAG TPA: wax ester/triacylglycerol synthase family O-acyltransferase [Acidimicrobiaceae bacterium]|nr:wax ester/triacylglycerol synthase family O-acyltransferase [Acidimicrobiaceae bacterium]
MERLSALDAEFLHVEDGIAHMHIAGVSVFEGPRPELSELTELVASKLHRIPRYRQRVRTVPLELGRPVWVDDPHFDLGYHIRHTALPAPGDDGALRRLMSRLMGQELDRERPLWEVWFVEGLEDGRWALISKVHHCMVDGVSGMDLLGILLDVAPDTPLPEPEAWSPEPEPSGVTKVLDAWSGAVADGLGLVARAPSALREPARAVGSLLDTGRGLFALTKHLGLTTPTTLEGSIGPHRSWAHSVVPLDDVKAVGKELGVTVNDVVLAVLAGAFRDLLVHRGEDPDTCVLRTLVPVSVRTEDARGVPDNRVSVILFELPVHVADPVERVQAVHEQMVERKASHMSEAGELVVRLADLAPPMVVGTVMRTATRVLARMPQRSVNTVTTNVPGPQLTLYCLGRRMLVHLPYVPLSHGVRIGVAILSYDGNLAFGVTGDRDTAADVEVLADAVVLGHEELNTRRKRNVPVS